MEYGLDRFGPTILRKVWPMLMRSGAVTLWQRLPMRSQDRGAAVHPLPEGCAQRKTPLGADNARDRQAVVALLQTRMYQSQRKAKKIW